MALLYIAWEADGKGQAQLASLRSDEKGASKFDWAEEQKLNPRCVLITKGRTDRQSEVETVLWQRPGYVDPVA